MCWLPLAVLLRPVASLFTLASLLTACAIGGALWTWLVLPTLCGALFSRCVTRWATMGHPVWLRSLYARPSIAFEADGWHVHLHLFAERFGFGNPPDFPHEAFVEADCVAIHASAPLQLVQSGAEPL
jgi:hypothetical protein